MATVEDGPGLEAETTGVVDLLLNDLRLGVKGPPHTEGLLLRDTNGRSLDLEALDTGVDVLLEVP